LCVSHTSCFFPIVPGGDMKAIEKIDIKRLQYKVAYERDERSYKLLFLHFYKGLTGFSCTYVKTQEAAEEIVSDLMIRLWNMQQKLDAIDNLKVYLFTATRNASINYLTRNNKYTHWDIENIDVVLNLDMYNPEDLLLRNEFRAKVAAAIRSLPPKCQMVYKLVREDGFTYREVATVMNISENTVDRHLNIALHKLTESVKAYLGLGNHG
jgi:RNA polymerase sigma-70 factor (family 1)